MMSPDRPDPALPGDRASIDAVPKWRSLLMTLALGLVAGVGSWLTGEGILRAYRAELAPAMKPIPTLDDAQLLLAARVTSGCLVFGMMGGWIGLAGGLAGGASQRSWQRAVRAGIFGLVLGTIGTAGIVRLVLPIFYTRVDSQAQDLTMPLIGHVALWMTSGAVGGLAYSLGAGRSTRLWEPALGGLLGAVLATVAYELAGALLLPTHRTHLPMPGTSATRAMAQIMVALGTVIGSSLEPGRPATDRQDP